MYLFSWRSLAQEVLDDEDCSVLFDDNPYTLFWRNNFIAVSRFHSCIVLYA